MKIVKERVNLVAVFGSKKRQSKHRHYLLLLCYMFWISRPYFVFRERLAINISYIWYYVSHFWFRNFRNIKFNKKLRSLNQKPEIRLSHIYHSQFIQRTDVTYAFQGHGNFLSYVIRTLRSQRRKYGGSWGSNPFAHLYMKIRCVSTHCWLIHTRAGEQNQNTTEDWNDKLNSVKP